MSTALQSPIWAELQLKIVSVEYDFSFPPHLDFEAAGSHRLKHTDKKYGAFVAPQQRIILHTFDPTKIINGDQVQEIRDNKKSLVLKGMIRYRDVVNDRDEHASMFLTYLDLSNDTWKFRKPADPSHNRYT